LFVRILCLQFKLNLWLLLITVLLLLNCSTLTAQKAKKILLSSSENFSAMPLNDSTVLFFYLSRGNCKNLAGALHYEMAGKTSVSGNEYLQNQQLYNMPAFPFHGNVAYDFFYRSSIDTPYAASNVQQHYVRASLQVVVKQLPLTIQVNSRKTNSWLFKNYTDVNVLFDADKYKNALKERLKQRMIDGLPEHGYEQKIQEALKKQLSLKEELETWLQHPVQLQKLVEGREYLNNFESNIEQYKSQITDVTGKAGKEDILHKQAAGKAEAIVNKAEQYKQPEKFLRKKGEGQWEKYKDTLTGALDSMATAKTNASRFLKEYEEREKQYKKVNEKVAALEKDYTKAKQLTKQKIDDIKNEVNNLKDPAALNKKLKTNKLDSSKAFKWYRHVNAVNKFSVGRSLVDYSELSAKNISVTGLNIEYNSKIYVALATGSVDYRYRDFIVRNQNFTRQYLNLVRVGVGRKEATNLIFTVYQGKKQANYYVNNRAATNKVFGVTVEGKYRLDKNNFIIAEFAKSSYPQTSSIQNIRASKAKTFDFKSHANEAFAIQLFSVFPATSTRLYGQYRHQGSNFQSFNIYNTNSDITAWQVRADQFFWKKRIFVTASLRKNDFVNPLIVNNTFKSNTVFKSIQATFRKRKWPVLSAGYMPSSQLTNFNNQVIENHFYTLMGSANYMYRFKKVHINTGILFTRFYNNASDASFIYYNAKSLLVHHNILGNRVSFNTSLAVSENNSYQLVTADQGFNYNINSNCSAGSGIKTNRLNHHQYNTGFYANVQVRLKNVGEFLFSFDRDFIPGVTNSLYKNDFGRATYIKTF
jgi:hypothetical protein